MSTRLTDAEHVALYDGTTHRAFGPTFSSSEHAEDFLTWCRGMGIQPEKLSSQHLDMAEGLWRETRTDDDGYLLAPGAAPIRAASLPWETQKGTTRP